MAAQAKKKSVPPKKAAAKSAVKKPPGKKAPAKVSNGRALVVVESPAKAKTIKKYLGAGFTVKASVGHVMDLPKSKMGVDVEHGFAPQYVVIPGKGKIISEIKKSANEGDVVYLA